MKYMMFVVVDPALQAEPTPDDLTIDQWLAEVDGRGQRITGDALRPPGEAVTVSLRHGEVLVTDGPFSETKEWIAGFDILDCDSLGEAIADRGTWRGTRRPRTASSSSARSGPRGDWSAHQ